MKKTNKMIWLAALALTAAAGLVACGGGGEDSGNESGTSTTSSKHTHKYGTAEVVKEATCTEEGEKVQKCECGETKTSKISKAAHSWVDVAEGSTPATCTEDGVQNQECSVCHQKQSKTLPATGHQLGEASVKTPATCTVDGVQEQECSVCHEKVESPITATGHTFGDTVWTSHATCDKDGVGEHECETCHEKEAVKEDKLGHNLVLVGGETAPEAGMATVRLYSCDREGCDTTYLGFKATEVTEESAKRLTFTGEGEDAGASFFGRPIGNKLDLDDTGTSVNQQVGELVFDETETGDFFEYKFNLTAEQAATLSNCRLYCDAKPAGYMGQNRVDFWAYGADSSDWTPGAYIDGERKGEIIDDYRYVLYVDGERKDFDSSMSTPVSRGDPRAEYVLPYLFNLHEGTNSIRLVMAGGYRSTFYNFTFRPVEAPAEDPVDPAPVAHDHAWTWGAEVAAEGKSTYKNGTCECGKKAIQILPGADVNGKLTNGGKLPKGASGKYDGTAIAKYAFNLPDGITGHLKAKVAVDNAGNYGYSFYTGKDSSGKTQSPMTDGSTNTVMTVNGANVTMPTTSYQDMGVTGTNEAGAGWADFGSYTFAAGDNEFTLAGTNSYGVLYYEFIIVQD